METEWQCNSHNDAHMRVIFCEIWNIWFMDCTQGSVKRYTCCILKSRPLNLHLRMLRSALYSHCEGRCQKDELHLASTFWHISIACSGRLLECWRCWKQHVNWVVETSVAPTPSPEREPCYTALLTYPSSCEMSLPGQTVAWNIKSFVILLYIGGSMNEYSEMCGGRIRWIMSNSLHTICRPVP